MSQLEKIRYGLLLVLLITSNNMFASSFSEYQKAMEVWGNLLRTHVDAEGRIDFNGIAAEPSDLASIVKVLEGYGPNSHPEDFVSIQQKLAYHINTYNALAMHGVIERGIPGGFTNFFSRASFFRLRKVTIAGEEISLHTYENKVIRPLNEPRLHFALNCMVRDCPRLPKTAFNPENLEEQLEKATLEFFSKSRHLRFDHEKKRVYVSAILDFYTEDFVASGRVQDLASYINQYLITPLPEDYQIRFIDYDWRINSQTSED